MVGEVVLKPAAQLQPGHEASGSGFGRTVA